MRSSELEAEEKVEENKYKRRGGKEEEQLKESEDQ